MSIKNIFFSNEGKNSVHNKWFIEGIQPHIISHFIFPFLNHLNQELSL